MENCEFSVEELILIREVFEVMQSNTEVWKKILVDPSILFLSTGITTEERANTVSQDIPRKAFKIIKDIKVKTFKNSKQWHTN